MFSTQQIMTEDYSTKLHIPKISYIHLNSIKALHNVDLKKEN